jgi:hypothetical protein
MNISCAENVCMSREFTLAELPGAIKGAEASIEKNGMITISLKKRESLPWANLNTLVHIGKSESKLAASKDLSAARLKKTL